MNWDKVLQWAIDWLRSFQTGPKDPIIQTQQLKPPTMSQPPTPPPAPPTAQNSQPGALLWDTPQNGRHSVRLICDEVGMSVKDKNDMCGTIGAESVGCYMSYYPKDYKVVELRSTPIKRENILHGKVWSTDWGLCQWNDYYHGKEMPKDKALNDPEAAVRLMAYYWMKGEAYKLWWVAYKNGSYKAYL